MSTSDEIEVSKQMSLEAICVKQNTYSFETDDQIMQATSSSSILCAADRFKFNMSSCCSKVLVVFHNPIRSHHSESSTNDHIHRLRRRRRDFPQIPKDDRHVETTGTSCDRSLERSPASGILRGTWPQRAREYPASQNESPDLLVTRSKPDRRFRSSHLASTTAHAIAALVQVNTTVCQ